METEEVPLEWEVSSGSILEPTLLWNLMYDGVLQLQLPDGVSARWDMLMIWL